DVIRLRLRRGGGVSEVRKKLRLLLAHIRYTGVQPDTYFVVGMDNDRALEHPSHQPLPHSDETPCRHCALMNALHSGMPDGWPIPGAIAVPVQMIESWLLLMHDRAPYPAESALPPFARKDQPAARQLLGPSPAPQLKDLVDLARGEQTPLEFALGCVLTLDAKALAARSPSFERFCDQILAWTT
ncbi:MAG: hypothetical protein ACRENE_31125, partial [Polyangiaceae bacterium]